MSTPSNDSRPSGNTKISCPSEFTHLERRQLLALAHEAILSALERREISTDFDVARFAAPRGAFTTLYLHGKLRGCVGYPLPAAPLHRTIVETARGAAFEDTRFPPITLDEAREILVSLSILSPLKAISPEEVEIGIHGLLISQHGRRGLLLPQVPSEHGWDRVTFLEQTCRKAGLPPGAWQSGATIQIFSAEIFGDRDVL
ncbi:MAG: AmmeMemoRadiSam system protein A [Terriglobales bacterium]